MSELRMYAIINREALAKAGGNRGKMMAQAGHAFLHAWWHAWDNEFGEEDRDAFVLMHAIEFKNSGAAVKIVLEAENETALREIEAKARDMDIGVSLVVDAGRTVFSEPTVTFLGLGPIHAEDAPIWLRDLKVFM